MSKKNQATEAKPDKTRRYRTKLAAVAKPASKLGGPIALPYGLINTVGGDTIQAQITRLLSDERLQSAQGQTLAAQFGRTLGNRRMQQIYASLNQNDEKQAKSHHKLISRLAYYHTNPAPQTRRQRERTEILDKFLKFGFYSIWRGGYWRIYWPNSAFYPRAAKALLTIRHSGIRKNNRKIKRKLKEAEKYFKATRKGRRDFPGVYLRFVKKLTQTEKQAMSAFMNTWELPNKCPFANAPTTRLNRREKALLAGAMLTATGTRGTDCGDWVMLVYSYSQGRQYVSRRRFRANWKRENQRRRQRGLNKIHSEYRWTTISGTGGSQQKNRAITSIALRDKIKPGYWIMYKTSPGHSILVLSKGAFRSRHTIRWGRTRVLTSTLKVDAMESGIFSGENIHPRRRTITLNCGDLRRGRRLVGGSVYNIMEPVRRTSIKDRP